MTAPLMSPAPGDTAGATLDPARAAGSLLAGLAERPWGRVSPSVYETARLVSLVPWLTGHGRRVAYLLHGQRSDGRWGPADDGYALVPTLSATEALLSSLRRGPADRASTAPAAPGTPGSPPVDVLAAAADRGLQVLRRRLLDTRRADLPDMPAIELIVPYLLELINGHLDALATGPASERSRPWQGRETGRLEPPAGMDGDRLTAIKATLETGAAVPHKLLHALETMGATARGLRTVGPEHTGGIGASPAATAAWLGDTAARDPAGESRRYLETVVGHHDGPVPCGIPITVFERAWVLGTLLRAGLPVTVPPDLVRSLRGALGPVGTPAAAGLPPDADTTSGTLYALALCGAPEPPAALWAYELGTHFCTWPGEQGFSVTTNAHVLEALGESVRGGHRPATAGGSDATRPRTAMRKISAVLREHQRPDGSWLDRWHASPFYATACCALALSAFGGPESADAVRGAVRWLLATQRQDGSWGRWEGTAEETAYAVQILRPARSPLDLAGDGAIGEAADRAVARAREFLLRSIGRPDRPALWHDKDLYLPAAIVDANILAALHLAERPCTAGRKAGAALS